MHPDDAEFEAAIAVMVAKLGSINFTAWVSGDREFDIETAFAFACLERLVMLKSKASDDEFKDWCALLRDLLEAMFIGCERHRARKA